MGAAIAINWEGNPYMPLKLKGILARYGIRQSTVCETVKQSFGRLLSSTSFSQICNWGKWPKLTDAKEIMDQVNGLMRDSGVTDLEIAEAWEIDSLDSGRGAHPVGVHVGQVPTKKNPVPEIEPMEVEMLSPNAKRHFMLFRDPFSDDVNGPEDVFMSSDYRYIREAMYQTAKNAGLLAVIAESGAGKSVLRKDLLDRIKREGLAINVIFPRIIDKASLTAGAICEAIIQDLKPGEPMRQTLEGKARQLEKMLLDSSRADNVHVLIIEEAHDLSVKTLKLLKRFWELEDGFKRLLSIILVGQPELKGLLDERTTFEAREVIRRCEKAELPPLNNQLEEYLAHKFKRAGVEMAKVLGDDCFDAIRGRLTKVRTGSREVYSQLYPLVVNNLVTRAMNRAAEIGVPLVTSDLVKEL